MIKRVLFVLAVCLPIVCVSFAQEADPSPFPDTMTYQGQALSADGQPLDGTHAMRFAFMAPDSEQVLLAVTMSRVDVSSGRFTVELGGGQFEAGSEFSGLRDLFAGHSELELEVTIDDRLQSPRIRVLPAGHSQATIAALSGPQGGDDSNGPHWKGWESRSQETAVQAAVLRPGTVSAAVRSGAERRTNPFETPVFYLGESVAVRDLPRHAPGTAPAVAEQVNPPRHEDLFDARGRRFGTSSPKARDASADRSTNHARTADPILSFEGIGNVNGVLPPDTEGTVGPNHYVQAVNLSFAVYDKAGTLLTGPSNINTLWAGFGGPCQTNNSGDPIFLYDEAADRFVLTQFAVSGAQSVCFAVSTTPDPTGTYHLYELVAQRFPDYYKLGVWPDADNNAYFMTTNSGSQNGYDVYAVDRANLLTGGTVRPAQFFQSFYNLFMPADVDGDVGPSGPGILYTFRDGGEPYFGSPAEDSLDIWEYDVDWTTPANSSLTLVDSIVPPELDEFNWTVCGFFGSNCLPQPDTAQGIDSASWWPMQRLQYRNFGDYETLVGTWTVDVTGSPDHAAPRWFELRRSTVADGGVGWSVHQQGTYAPDSDHRFMPSISMDGYGNIAIGYSVTSETTYPSIRYATRAAGDPPGTLQVEAELMAGTGSQTHSAARWGDYASMDVDPVDDCTFWFTTEYIQTTGSAPWRTRVGTFRVPGCGAMAVVPSHRTLCTDEVSTSFGVELLDQFTGATDLTHAGCPAGATCSFTPPQITPPTTSTFDVDGLNGVTPGAYEITLTATDNGDPGNTVDVPVDLVLFDPVGGAPVLTGPGDGAIDVSVTPTLTWNAVAGATTYDLELATDPGFTEIVASVTLFGTSYEPTELATLTTYYWRVKASNVCGESAFATAFSFTTVAGPGDCIDSLAVPTVFEDFESGAAGWTHSGLGDTWQLSSTTTHSGTNAYWAEDVPVTSDQYLVSPVFAVPAVGSNPTLQFWNDQTIESSTGPAACWDGAVLEISTNGGGTWTRLESELLSDPYDGAIEINPANPLEGENAWCGDPQPWINSVVDLSAWVGQNVQFRFRLATDGAVGRIGWFIDDVTVQSCVSEEIFSDGFESGDTSGWDATSP